MVTESPTPSCTPSSCRSSVFLLLFLSSFRAILSDISSHTRTHCPYLCLDRVCRSWKNVTPRDRSTGRASVLNATVKFAFLPSYLLRSIVRSFFFFFHEKNRNVSKRWQSWVALLLLLLLPLPEAAQPLGQQGRASQVISNGAATVAGKHHHVLGPVRRRRRTPRVQGRPAGGAEAARAQVLVTGRRLAAT